MKTALDSHKDKDDFAKLLQNCEILEGHTEVVFCVATVNGCLASGSEDNTIRLWNTERGEVEGVLNGHQGYVHSLV